MIRNGRSPKLTHIRGWRVRKRETGKEKKEAAHGPRVYRLAPGSLAKKKIGLLKNI